ncbi:MAG: hypothetical protein ACRDHL_04965 [Candidatus Promineifilaceae bacterium]
MRPFTRLDNAFPLRRPGLALLSVLALSVLLRLAVAVYLGDSVPPQKDETSYSLLAARLVSGRGFSFPEDWYPFSRAGAPTAHWSFLYTGFVAAVYALVGVHPLAVRLLSAVLGGVLLPLMLYRLGRRVFPESGWLPLVAAAGAAVYAYFVLFAAQLMTETFYIAAVLASLERSLALEGAIRRAQRIPAAAAAGLGLSLGIATLLRQSILPWVAVLFLYLAWLGWRGRRLRSVVKRLGLTAGVLLAFALPFTVRNYMAYGEFLLLNSNAGYAMYSAQHPMHGVHFQAYAAAPLPADIGPRPETEAEWDQFLMRRGLEFVIAEPGRYALLSLSRLADYFMFWPAPETGTLHTIGRVGSFGLFLPLMTWGLWLSRHAWLRFRLLYLFMAFYSLLHILTWAMVRYRLPVDSILLLFAALPLSELAFRLAKWRGERVGRPAFETLSERAA